MRGSEFAGIGLRGPQTRVLLHAVNAAMLFAVLGLVTVAPAPRLAIVLLFALHPLRIEAVAGSDGGHVVSGTLWLVALLAYARHLSRPGSGRRLLASLAALPAMMATPAGGALPLLMGLMGGATFGTPQERRRRWREVAPLLVIGVAVFFTQGAGRAGSIVPGADATAWLVAQWATAHGCDLGRLILPVGLAPFRPEIVPAWWSPLAAVALVAATAAATWHRSPMPFLHAGWLGYLLTLLPVSGTALADGASYVPHIALAFAFAAGGEVLRRVHGDRRLTTAAGAAALLCAAALATQLPGWRDPDTILRRALATHGGTAAAHRELATRLRSQGRDAEAIAELRSALRIDPADVEAHRQLAMLLAHRDAAAAAVFHLRTAVSIDPTSAPANADLAHLLYDHGRIDEAITHFRRALAREPATAETHLGLAHALQRRGEVVEAVQHAEAGLARRPGWGPAHRLLGALHAGGGQLEEAMRHYEAALAAEARDPETWHRLGNVRARLGDLEGAVVAYRAALELDPAAEDARRHLGIALTALGAEFH